MDGRWPVAVTCGIVLADVRALRCNDMDCNVAAGIVNRWQIDASGVASCIISNRLVLEFGVFSLY